MRLAIAAQWKYQGIGPRSAMTYNLVMPPTGRIAKRIISIDHYTLAPVAWLIMLYIATAFTAGCDVTPEGGIELVLFEARHVAIHLLAFAIQSWLIARAIRPSGHLDTRRSSMWLIALVLVLSVGQEALQSLYRSEVRVLASLWDLAVDTVGGAAGWWWYRHRRIDASH